MPRLPPSLFWQARSISPLAASLLKTCRDLPSALNELRWIREHVSSSSSSSSPSSKHHDRVVLHKLCARRARGEPLQYILGSQPFGDLDILCRRGVLIPRPETEAYTMKLARILQREARNHPYPQSPPPPVRIIDVCTGTGCIALQLFRSLQPIHPTLHVSGIDISPSAISLARANLVHNNLLPPTTTQTQTITFHKSDLFSPSPFPLPPNQSQKIDLLISNPPYISLPSYHTTTARSVRNHEPPSPSSQAPTSSTPPTTSSTSTYPNPTRTSTPTFSTRVFSASRPLTNRDASSSK
ncbi:S-adenosylmethionine-dependent methyltransferase [Cercophora scortea]|uniref:S-adenosylmethionine-dependent methyltransferase n=1 Tax=Cercophora scortea TaxID=314031 RepID=A0AAE0IP73_9PEZI|nr:S-adenosylmethionine-dependent methyltransferase [Cercophora scortea]